MAKNMARIENGVVVNIEWHASFREETETLKEINGLHVGIGDTYDGYAFYHNGEKLLTPLEKANDKNAELATALQIMVGESISPSIIEQTYAIRTTMDEVGAILTPDQAAQYPYLYRSWNSTPDANAIMTLALDEDVSPLTAYFCVGTRRRYNGVVYECIKEHYAEIGVTPDLATDKWNALSMS